MPYLFLSICYLAMIYCSLATVVAGLIITLRYRRLSAYAWLVTAGFSVLSISLGLRAAEATIEFLVIWSPAMANTFIGRKKAGSMVLAALFNLAGVAGSCGWICLVTGLALVFKDLRNQINGLRGLLAERHLEHPSGT